MNALLLIDIQNDFMPQGALAIAQSDAIIPVIDHLTRYPFDLIIAIKDWHLEEHGSFARNHGKNPGDHIQLAGIDQILWVDHCVQGTLGAEFASGWDTTSIDKIFYKGTDCLMDSYSTFFDNGHQKSTGLENYLKEKGVSELYIAGLATDYCIKYSVLDALELGFHCYVIKEGCKGVDLTPGDSKRAWDIMLDAGAHVISIENVKDQLQIKSKF